MAGLHQRKRNHHATNQPVICIHSVAISPDDKIILFPVVLKVGKDKRQGVKVI